MIRNVTFVVAYLSIAERGTIPGTIESNYYASESTYHASGAFNY